MESQKRHLIVFSYAQSAKQCRLAALARANKAGVDEVLNYLSRHIKALRRTLRKRSVYY
jgi:hypothetical protein